MISLTCTHCQTVLNIDDAFAGGVCRCKHCGTIQTVPSRLKGGASPKPAKVNAPRELYRRGAGEKESPTGSGTGLDELANIVASSGLLNSGSGLGSSRLRKSSGAAPPVPRSLTIWLAIAGIVIVVLLAIVLWLSVSRNGARSGDSNLTTTSPPILSATDAGTDAASNSAPSEPMFCDLKLKGNVIIYVLDRGNGTRDSFDTLKEVTFKSIASLGQDRKFQVIFWKNGQQEDAYPAGLPAYATATNITACRRATEDIAAFGQTDAQSALRKAFANHADVIVLVTGKSLELDQSFVDSAMSARSTSGAKSAAKIDTIAIGDADSSILRDLATQTGGEYRAISASKLRSFSD